MNTPQSILQDVFGYSYFRDRQEAIITSVLDGADNLVIMPTGGGKSLCYQIPALVKDGLSIIVSPLIALMNDQVLALQELNVPARTLHSHIDEEEKRLIYSEIESGHLKMLYVSPEGLLQEHFLNFLVDLDIALFAIDEAHCVSVWGNDFRPEYVKLSILKDRFPNVAMIALTATADFATQADIIQQLKLYEPEKFVSSFERDNIVTNTLPGQKRIQQIIQFLRGHKGESGIVYCLSRKSTEKVAADLISAGFNAMAYHAGIAGDLRSKVQRDFQNDKVQIICATIAFGMGIDKPNIRFVIHYNMPKNIESYYQEIGRGGRDGKPAEALLFYSWSDYLNLKKFIDNSEASDTFKGVQTAKLERIWEFANAASCRTNLVLSYFGEFKSSSCDHCDNCLSPPEIFDGSTFAQMALSAIYRSGEQVGMNMLIDVLRGSYKQEVRQAGFDQLKTFGVGRDIQYLDWKHYITQMINQGLLSIDFTQHSRLKLTPFSMEALKGQKSISLTKFVRQEEKKKGNVKKVDFQELDIDESLYGQLKKWRMQQANKQRVPAYVVLHNRALEQIAKIMPKDNIDLMSVDGIGQAKANKYGEAIISLIQSYKESKGV